MNREKSAWKELVELVKKPLERLWNAVSKEKIKELKIDSITTAFLKSLENKNFSLEKGKVKISKKELEREPKEIANQLSSILEKIE